MEKKKHMIGNMLFEDYNKLPYEEQCEYINSIKPIITESADDLPLRTIEIGTSIEEYVKRYNLVSLNELRRNIHNIEEKAIEMHDAN